MKIIVLLLVVLIEIFFLCGCKITQIKEDESTTGVLAEIQTTENSASDSNASLEGYTSELIAPEFDYPANYNNIIDQLGLPKSDNSKKNGDTEDFYSNGKLVYQCKYESNGEIATITVYESDSITQSIIYKFVAAQNDEKAVDIQIFKESQVFERRKYTYYANSNIKSIYSYAVDEKTSAPLVNSYFFNENGELTQCISSDNFNQIISDAILGGLTGNN